MKNFSALLQRGNLTPKERYLLLIQNDVMKENTGKECLTAADKEALQNWQAENDKQAREWNTLNDGWKMSGLVGVEAEFVYMQTEVEHFRMFFMNLQLNFYPFYRQELVLMKSLEKIKTVDIQEAERIAKKQREEKLKDGMDFEYATYKLAFETMSDDDKEKLIELFPDVKTEHDYLDQEEMIADLFDGKDELTRGAKEKLAELVAGRSYNEYAKEYQLFHYFACIPLAEVARRFLTDKGIQIKGKALAKDQGCDDEDSGTHDDVQKAVEKYAKDHGVTIEAILKEGCLKWLDEDLLEEYTPLVTCNAYELFERWLTAKAEARKTLQKLITSGKLKIRERTADEIGQDTYCNETRRQKLEEKVLGKKPDNRIITGESLYNFKGEYEFIKDFKERTDTYDANLGIVYADDDPEHRGEHLDQEFLVSNKNMHGELNIFSMYGLTTKRLRATFESTQFIKETIQDGEVILDFATSMLRNSFMDRKKNLADGYSRLLAFRDFFKKLSKVYEVDLCVRLNEKVQSVENFIDQHNKALRTATGKELSDDDPEEHSDNWLTPRKIVARMKDDYSIDKDSIVPDPETVKSCDEKFRETFRGSY